jgi:DtxR family transcriptional regulator, Mn-dependent transcriptional regulator
VTVFSGPGGAGAVFAVQRGAPGSRIGEPIQSDTVLLTHLRRAGFRPNATVAVSQANGRVRIGTGQQAAELDHATAAHIFVTTAD